ncbi:MAG: aspartate aminotransferase family protein [Candidatus Bathyarchaeota archaeon]|nr:aspartate aminotransferase family protein [Candidatus Bathyarchaeota archaeon]
MEGKPGPRTAGIIKNDDNLLGLPLKIRFYPMVIEEARGVMVKDPDGFEYIDFTGNWAVANVGYSHPEVVDAVKRQVEKTSCVSLCAFSNDVSVKLAEKLVEITPGSFKKRVWFGLSGSDANDCVFKIMPKYAGKPRIISFIGAYHGQTMGSLSLSGHQAQARFLGFPGVVKVPYAYCYRCPFKMEYPTCDLYCISFIEDIIFKSVCPPDETAGLVVEPIQCDGGDVVPPREYLPRLQKLCKENDMLLAVDEVKVGFGRTGSMFAVQEVGVEPDMLILGKPIASGMPLSACVARAEIFEILSSSHLFTTGGYPVSCAAGLATIEVIEGERLHENARKVGEHMMGRLQEMMEQHRLIGDVRGRGLLIGVELVKDRGSKEPAKTETAKLCYRAWELGLLTEYVGLHSNVVEITPPLILTKEQADRGLDLLDRALSDVEAGKVPDEKIAAYTGW